MRRIGQQIKFEEIRDFIQRQITMVEKRPQSDKLQMLEAKIKELDGCLKRIRQRLMGDKRFNQGDVRLKVNNYQQQIRQLKRKLQDIILKYKKQLLVKKSSRDHQKKYDFKDDYEELYDRKNKIEGQFQRAAQRIQQTNVVFNEQAKQTKEFINVVDDTQAELDLITQFMRTISNRNLLTKIILLLLIIFLGLADLAVFVIKIT